MAKHKGKFKWKKYSRYRGNLRYWWEWKGRMAEHRLEPLDG